MVTTSPLIIVNLNVSGLPFLDLRPASWQDEQLRYLWIIAIISMIIIKMTSANDYYWCKLLRLLCPSSNLRVVNERMDLIVVIYMLSIGITF